MASVESQKAPEQENEIGPVEDSAIGLHREFFAYDGTVDAKDVLAQVIEYKYRTSALEKNVRSRRKKRRTRSLDTLHDIFEEISDSLEDFLLSHATIKTQASSIMATVNEMKKKLANGAYGAQAMSAKSSSHTTAPETRKCIQVITTQSSPLNVVRERKLRKSTVLRLYAYRHYRTNEACHHIRHHLNALVELLHPL
ncbi:hypothetical protein TELCIR_00919 [Teladorsagia circumcincta]|uniref:Uncharacterized protein n=1 Tax=Teladorsagia circumcincta TaxID=45464 RepID=A0A2G9V394_TELCI|nr:hypothetical protein TELCIR_00919 [Teladorsagia circumcincta]